MKMFQEDIEFHEQVEINKGVTVNANVTVNGVITETNPVLKRKRVVLTDDQIRSMYTTPIRVVDGVAGKYIVVSGCNYYRKIGSGLVQFSGGGAVNLYYDITNGLLMGTLLNAFSSAIMNDDNNVTAYRVQSSSGYSYVADHKGAGILITNTIGAFTGGTGSSLILDIFYTEVEYN